VIQDVLTKEHSMNSLVSKLPASEGYDEGEPRDIVIVFHVRKSGKYQPIDDIASRFHYAYSGTPEEQAVSSAVTGAPVSVSSLGMSPDSPPAPAMPCLTKAQCDLLESTHREKIPDYHLPYNACVARPVPASERLSNPKAMESIAKEWHRLRNIKHHSGVGVWAEHKVEEFHVVQARYRKRNEKVHFARIFDICVEKGSELEDGNPEKKYKGRAVLQGDQVKDENWEAALFQDLSSSPAALEASRAANAYGLLPGHDVQQADADSAYTQSYLEGTDTWVRLPKEQWPEEWLSGPSKMRDPVCPLILSLYGHPDAGG